MKKPRLHPQGKPLRVDPNAASADPALPAFLARPVDAPVYHGFPLLEESRTNDGWCFGMISDPDCPEGRNWGDAFVVAPDNSRAGLIWHVGPPELQVSCEPSVGRWGVYTIGITREVHSRAELVEQLREWLPELQRRHAVWAAREVELCMEDCALRTAGVEYGMGLLGMELPIDPVKAQGLIEDFLQRFRSGQIKEPLDENTAAYLGVLWGMTIVLAYGWNWVAVAHGDWRGFGVADPERKYLALPVSFFHTLMHDKAGEQMPGPAVRFKAIGANYLPPSKRKAFTVITS